MHWKNGWLFITMPVSCLHKCAIPLYMEIWAVFEISLFSTLGRKTSVCTFSVSPSSKGLRLVCEKKVWSACGDHRSQARVLKHHRHSQRPSRFREWHRGGGAIFKMSGYRGPLDLQVKLLLTKKTPLLPTILRLSVTHCQGFLKVVTGLKVLKQSDFISCVL